MRMKINYEMQIKKRIPKMEGHSDTDCAMDKL